MRKKEIRVEKLEFCPYCETKVWSLALHNMLCPVMNPDKDPVHLREEEEALSLATYLKGMGL